MRTATGSDRTQDLLNKLVLLKILKRWHPNALGHASFLNETRVTVDAKGVAGHQVGLPESVFRIEEPRHDHTGNVIVTPHEWARGAMNHAVVCLTLIVAARTHPSRTYQTVLFVMGDEPGTEQEITFTVKQRTLKVGHMVHYLY